MFRSSLLIPLLVLMMIATVAAFADQEVLTNESIIKMVKVGLANDLIILKINEATTVRFDFSTDALIALKQAGVADDIIRAMKAKQGTAAALAPSTPTAIAPSAPVSSSSVEQFPEAQYLVKAPGQEKAQAVKGILVFDPTSKNIRFLSGGVSQLEVPYANLTGLLYEKTAKPRYGLGILVAWPLLFTKSKAHYLTIQYKSPQGTGQFAIIRLHKKNFQVALATAEAQTGIKVERSEEH